MKFEASALGIFLIASAVHAQESPPSPSETVTAPPQDEEEARALFSAGEVAYHQGNYDRALSYFEQAYALASRPALLFNIGSAAERIREDDKAIDAYERYLAAVPDAPNRRAVLSRLEILRRHRSPDHGLASVEPEGGGSAATERSFEATGAVESESSLNPWGWAILGGAAAALGLSIGGVVWWLDRQSATDECETPGFFCENRSTLDGEQAVALGTWIGGTILFAGAAATGLVVLLSGESNEDGALAHGLPCGVGPGSLTCGGSF